jgi:hypothetical protein
MSVTQLYNLFVNKEPSIFIEKNFLYASNIGIQNIQDKIIVQATCVHFAYRYKQLGCLFISFN